MFESVKEIYYEYGSRRWRGRPEVGHEHDSADRRAPRPADYLHGHYAVDAKGIGGADSAAAATRGSDYERALTLRVLARVDESSSGHSYPDARAESQAILDRLGVVWTPDLA